MINTIGLLINCRRDAIIKRGMTRDTSGIMRVARIPSWIVRLSLNGMRTNTYAAKLPIARLMTVTEEAILMEFNNATPKVRGTEEAASLGKKISRLFCRLGWCGIQWVCTVNNSTSVD